jgi:phosphoribosylformylglycinamidine (FGAM) synthase PurS component
MIRQNGNSLQINIEIDRADEEQEELTAIGVCENSIANCIVCTWETDGELRLMFETPEWPR